MWYLPCLGKAHFVPLNYQTCSETKAASSHLHVLHEVPHCKWLHSPGHLLLTALPWRLALPRSRIMTACFTPQTQLPCPKLQAQCCLHSRPWALQRKALYLLCPSDKSMVLLLPVKFTLTYWTGNKSTGSRRNGVGKHEITPRHNGQSQRKADA